MQDRCTERKVKDSCVGILPVLVRDCWTGWSDSDNTLRAFCNEEDDRKAVSRTLRFVRILLHVLCEHILKEETPESCAQIRFLHISTRSGISWHSVSVRALYEQTTLDGSSCRMGGANIERRKGDNHLFPRQDARASEPAHATRR